MTLIRVTHLDGTVVMMPPHAGKWEYLATHATLEERVKDDLYDGIAFARNVARRDKWRADREFRAASDSMRRRAEMQMEAMGI